MLTSTEGSAILAYDLLRALHDIFALFARLKPKGTNLLFLMRMRNNNGDILN